MAFVRVCSRSDFQEGRYLAVLGEGDDKQEIALFDVGGEVHAISNLCAHMGGPLIDGTFDDHGYIVCPWHGYQYDPRTGKGPSGYDDQVERFEIEVRGDDVYVDPAPIGSRVRAEHSHLRWEVPSSASPATEWMCVICREGYTGSLPPEACAKCLAPWELIHQRPDALATFGPQELLLPTYPVEERHAAAYLTAALRGKEFTERRLSMYRLLAQQPPIDVLVVSGSAHSHHIVSGFIAPAIIKRVQETKPDLAVEWIDLVKYRIDHNWACYSMADDHCRFPCNNMEDDMRGLYSKIVRAKSVMICTPINWEGMNSRLKVFLDRLTNLQDIPLKVGHIDSAGRPCGIFVNGHEDGAYKVAWDVYVHFQNMGYVLAPFGIWYNLASLSANTNEDLDKLRNNEMAVSRLHKVVDNVVATMGLRIDQQLSFQPEGEKLRRVSYVAM